MSYSDCMARISQLDALMRNFDPTWAASGRSLVSGTGTGSSASSFATVLQNETASTTPAAASATATTASTTKTHPVIKPVGPTTLVSPLSGARLTQPFGPTDVELEPSATVNGVTYPHYHNGIDLAAALGTPVKAAADGVVTFAGKQSDGAIVVKISHNDDCTTLYGHLDANLSVKVGQRVSIGQTIGTVGLTGVTTGPHLHFGIYSNFNNAWVDPSPYLAAGHLPDRYYLVGPSATDPGAMVQVTGATALAHFDAIASHIPYAAQIRAAAVAAGIDPTLLASLVYAESNFHPAALSPSGAMGLTQLMPSAAKTLGVDPWDIQQNLNGGAKYISNLLTRFGRTDLALAAYNAGPGAIAALGRVPDSKKPYVTKILTKWKSYQELSS